jgi:hypothetical protein
MFALSTPVSTTMVDHLKLTVTSEGGEHSVHVKSDRAEYLSKVAIAFSRTQSKKFLGGDIERVIANQSTFD